MTSPPDHPPIRCVLELRYDGTLTITRLPGCTESDVHDLLRLLAQSDGPFDYVTILPEPAEAVPPQLNRRPAAEPATAARYPTPTDIVQGAVTAPSTYD